MEADYKSFINLHEIQLVLSGVPSHFWPKLFEKLTKEVFDAGSYFSMLCQEHDEDDQRSKNGGEALLTPSEPTDEQPKSRSSSVTSDMFEGSNSKWKVVVCKHDGISSSDPTCIFLVDHAWTFKAQEARQHLDEVPALLERMCQMTDVNPDGQLREDLVSIVLDKIWSICQTYSIQNENLPIEEKMAVWYVLDEFGTRIRHCDNSNFRLVPFYYAPERCSYSLLFPKVDLPHGGEVTRDYIEGSSYHHTEWRQFYLLPWIPRDFSYLPYKYLLPGEEFFKENRENESLPSGQISLPRSSANRILKVFSEDPQVNKFLSHPSFTIIQSEDDADVLWLHRHFKDYKSLVEIKPDVLVNQFPFESVLTVKDLLAACVHLSFGAKSEMDKNMESAPVWFPTTFNLKLELPQFVSYFQNREKLDLDNTWIVKPWNLARALDTYVTNDLKQIVRLIDTGPKIACKYIEDPVLFYRSDINSWVKFDLRFIVLLKSAEPLTVYVYDRFWLRFALKNFSLDTFDDYEKHFTVFNYLDKGKILQMFCNDFIDQFDEQYPNQNWNDVMSNIRSCLKEVFACASRHPPPRGLAALPQCRAMYGVDMMLKWVENERGIKTIQPVLLEVNFMPDCARACDYYPDFTNSVFETLFLDDIGKDVPVTLL